MHKKLATDLVSLAHRILQMKDKDDVLALKNEAYQVYEKLTVLAYIDEYLATTPNASETKEELVAKLENVTEKIIEQPIVATNSDPIPKIEQPFDELEEALFGDENPYEKNDVKDIGEKKTLSLEDELDDTISLDVAVEMFEKVPQKKSINDIFQNDIQIDLNDRIAFVKHLFNGNQEDFNRVISQLNTLKTEKESLNFINTMIKPEYDWSNKEVYEERFVSLITRKFA